MLLVGSGVGLCGDVQEHPDQMRSLEIQWEADVQAVVAMPSEWLLFWRCSSQENPCPSLPLPTLILLPPTPAPHSPCHQQAREMCS